MNILESIEAELHRISPQDDADSYVAYEIDGEIVIGFSTANGSNGEALWSIPYSYGEKALEKLKVMPDDSYDQVDISDAFC